VKCDIQNDLMESTLPLIILYIVTNFKYLRAIHSNTYVHSILLHSHPS